MSLFPCSACDTRPPGKLASVTYAWNRADGERSAWRQRLCTTCFVDRVLKLPEQAYDAPVTCPGCGIATADDMDPIFCTAFLPGQGRFDYEWPFCAPCAARWHAIAQDHAQQLEDRREQFGGLVPGPQTGVPSPSMWDIATLRPVREPLP